MSRRRTSASLMILGLLGCDGGPDDPPPPPPGRAPLTEYDQWDRVEDVGEDVFGAERPSDEVCDEVLGIGSELFDTGMVLEIKTDLCNYATVQQPSLEPLAAGDTMELQVWHYDLTAREAAQAHLALAIDRQVVWEQLVPVPSEAGLLEAEIAVDRDMPAGTDLQFHVHNHGPNSYALLTLEVVRAESRAHPGPVPEPGRGAPR